MREPPASHETPGVSCVLETCLVRVVPHGRGLEAEEPQAAPQDDGRAGDLGLPHFLMEKRVNYPKELKPNVGCMRPKSRIAEQKQGEAR
jgi:hypothetical protein